MRRREFFSKLIRAGISFAGLTAAMEAWAARKITVPVYINDLHGYITTVDVDTVVGAKLEAIVKKAASKRSLKARIARQTFWVPYHKGKQLLSMGSKGNTWGNWEEAHRQQPGVQYQPNRYWTIYVGPQGLTPEALMADRDNNFLHGTREGISLTRIKRGQQICLIYHHPDEPFPG